MSAQELHLNGAKRNPAGAREWRDLAIAWLAAAAIVAAVAAAPSMRGAGLDDSLPDLAPADAPAESATVDDGLVPDGIGDAHGSIAVCSERDYADERC